MKHTKECNVTNGFSRGEICNCHGTGGSVATANAHARRQYEGQAHHMAKAADSLVNQLSLTPHRYSSRSPTVVPQD